MSAQRDPRSESRRRRVLARFTQNTATILRANKTHAYDISYLLGHHIEGVTKTYARESLDKLRQAADTLTEPWGKVISFNRRVG
jgi:hypothetical protein